MSRLPLGVSAVFGAALIGASILVSSTACGAVAETLIEPKILIVDSSLPKAAGDAEILAARRYDTFWNTGDPALAELALSKDFVDETPPPGRAQGPQGPLAASRTFRGGARPHLHGRAIVAGDRVVTHLRMKRHFTGTFQGRHGNGENVDFISTDIYRVADGRIAANWHIEDNLTFLKQLGVVKR